MDEVFRERYFHAADMWKCIMEGVRSRGDKRTKKFDEARKMLDEYVQDRDDKLLDWELLVEGHKKKLAKLRTRETELEEQVEDKSQEIRTLEASNSALSTIVDRYCGGRVKELESQIADIAEWLDQEHGICLPK